MGCCLPPEVSIGNAFSPSKALRRRSPWRCHRTMAALFCLFGLTDSVSHNFTPSLASPCSVTRGGPFTPRAISPRRASSGSWRLIFRVVFNEISGLLFSVCLLLAARVNVVCERGDGKRGTSGPSVNHRYSFWKRTCNTDTLHYPPPCSPLLPLRLPPPPAPPQTHTTRAREYARTLKHTHGTHL